jgi:tetratricopeptide (TPR) repeat protein
MFGSQIRHRPLLFVIAAVISLVAWLCWIAIRDPAVAVLMPSSSGQWIIFPKPPDTTPHKAVDMTAVFKRTFNLTQKPRSATLSIKSFKEAIVFVNDHRLSFPDLNTSSWKKSKSIDAADYLLTGTNVILIAVTNRLGPPALLAQLVTDGVAIWSDTNWLISLAGSSWQHAVPATEPPAIRPGNPLYGRETIGFSLRRIWPVLAIFLAASFTSWFCASRLPIFRRFIGITSEPNASWRILLFILLAWVALFINNLPQMAPLFGFDRDGHLEYIDYILRNWTLPLADEGWQMYQPPLFYVLCAIAVKPFAASTSPDGVILALRIASAVIGMMQITVIFLCLRLLFPNQRAKQIIGNLFAALIPASLYLSHHITNEGLASLFVTGSIYFCLQTEKTVKNPICLHLATGVCLGLALLTKFSTVLAVPAIVTATAWSALGIRQNSHRGNTVPFWPACKCLLIVSGAMLVVCGWHYARVWQHFGRPLVGNWDASLPFAWWQDPGFHTPAWYFRFGQTLWTPLFSSIHGLADGIYSSLWGDGLCSGSARMDFRPPWNYNLMNAGYLLALPLTLLLVLGLFSLVRQFLRAPSPVVFLILGLAFSFTAGFIYMAMHVPSYAQVKAFYVLPALMAFCAILVEGWETISINRNSDRPRSRPRLALFANNKLRTAILAILFLAWAATTYSSFWIRQGNPTVLLDRGTSLADDKRYAEATLSFKKALELAPGDVITRTRLADALDRLGSHDAAKAEVSEALREAPSDPAALIQAAITLTVETKYQDAVLALRDATRQAPDHPAAYAELATCLGWLGQYPQAEVAAREGLRINPFNPDLHYQLAMALAPQGKVAAAIEQYRYVLAFQPEHVQALNNLAWLLAASGDKAFLNGPEAVRLAQKACQLTHDEEPTFLGTLAAAYAEYGQFTEAITCAEKARALALSKGQKDVAAKNAELLELYRAGKAYHEPGK